MSLKSTELVLLFRRELELCRVKEDETVAVLSEAEKNVEYASAFMVAARDLGAHVFNVNLLPGRGAGLLGFGGAAALAGNRPAIEALKSADLVVDLMFLLFSKEQLEMQKAGARILLCVEPPEILQRLFPTTDLRERVEAAERRLANGHQLRFTNRAGTDVTYKLGKFPAMSEYGYTDTPGRWDHWPSGFAFTGAGETEVNGKVVMDRGDIIYPFASYLRDPIEFTIREGRIVETKGGLDAEMLRDYMASYRDPKAYGISHIGWGLNERANWTCHAQGVPGIGIEGRAFYGNVLFSTGPNTELGGDNDTACHLDLPMRNCTLYLDDDLILRDGEVMPEDMRAAGR
ncbi:MAG: leucyl aminopeptidase [Candidatus Binataceae bacterium]|nr:leucyl aminopeptidase [Candidatus Binataceae bacterium]